VSAHPITTVRRRAIVKLAALVARATTTVEARDDLIRLGSGYGGWWIPAGSVDANSVVYSAGVGEDVTFDLALIDRFGCHVWAMDPTPRSIEFAKEVENARFHFLPYGIWSEDGEQRFYAPANPDHVSHSIVNLQGSQTFFSARCRSLPSLLRELRHDRIDLLKMDIEGAEGPVLDDMIRNGPAPRVLCVEFEAATSPWGLRSRVRRLERAGYLVRKIDGRNYTLTLESP
jgi:FkbM family methyltransferase